jgi:hypothetical protein
LQLSRLGSSRGACHIHFQASLSLGALFCMCVVKRRSSAPLQKSGACLILALAAVESAVRSVIISAALDSRLATAATQQNQIEAAATFTLTSCTPVRPSARGQTARLASLSPPAKGELN